MKRFQVFDPEDLDRMSNAFLRASKQLQEAQKNQLAKAIVMTIGRELQKPRLRLRLCISSV